MQITAMGDDIYELLKQKTKVITPNVCKNCGHPDNVKIGTHKDGSKRLCCTKPEYISFENYLENSIYRPNDSDITLRAKIISLVYSRGKEADIIINQIKEIL